MDLGSRTPEPMCARRRRIVDAAHRFPNSSRVKCYITRQPTPAEGELQCQTSERIYRHRHGGGPGAGLRALPSSRRDLPDMRLHRATVSEEVCHIAEPLEMLCGGAAGRHQSRTTSAPRYSRRKSRSADLADQDVVEAFVREAPIEVIQMEHWGCPWSREPDGSVAVRPFGGMTSSARGSPPTRPASTCCTRSSRPRSSTPTAKRYDEWFATRLLVENGRCQGVAI